MAGVYATFAAGHRLGRRGKRTGGVLYCAPVTSTKIRGAPRIGATVLDEGDLTRAVVGSYASVTTEEAQGSGQAAAAAILPLRRELWRLAEMLIPARLAAALRARCTTGDPTGRDGVRELRAAIADWLDPPPVCRWCRRPIAAASASSGEQCPANAHPPPCPAVRGRARGGQGRPAPPPRIAAQASVDEGGIRWILVGPAPRRRWTPRPIACRPARHPPAGAVARCGTLALYPAGVVSLGTMAAALRSPRGAASGYDVAADRDCRSLLAATSPRPPRDLGDKGSWSDEALHALHAAVARAGAPDIPAQVLAARTALQRARTANLRVNGRIATGIQVRYNAPRGGVTRADLVQGAAVGLDRGTLDYDETRARHTTYSADWARQGCGEAWSQRDVVGTPSWVPDLRRAIEERLHAHGPGVARDLLRAVEALAEACSAIAHKALALKPLDRIGLPVERLVQNRHSIDDDRGREASPRRASGNRRVVTVVSSLLASHESGVSERDGAESRHRVLLTPEGPCAEALRATRAPGRSARILDERGDFVAVLRGDSEFHRTLEVHDHVTKRHRLPLAADLPEALDLNPQGRVSERGDRASHVTDRGVVFAAAVDCVNDAGGEGEAGLDVGVHGQDSTPSPLGRQVGLTENRQTAEQRQTEAVRATFRQSAALELARLLAPADVTDVLPHGRGVRRVRRALHPHAAAGDQAALQALADALLAAALPPAQKLRPPPHRPLRRKARGTRPTPPWRARGRKAGAPHPPGAAAPAGREDPERPRERVAAVVARLLELPKASGSGILAALRHGAPVLVPIGSGGDDSEDAQGTDGAGGSERAAAVLAAPDEREAAEQEDEAAARWQAALGALADLRASGDDRRGAEAAEVVRRHHGLDSVAEERAGAGGEAFATIAASPLRSTGRTLSREAVRKIYALGIDALRRRLEGHALTTADLEGEGEGEWADDPLDVGRWAPTRGPITRSPFRPLPPPEAIQQRATPPAPSPRGEDDEGAWSAWRDEAAAVAW